VFLSCFFFCSWFFSQARRACFCFFASNIQPFFRPLFLFFCSSQRILRFLFGSLILFDLLRSSPFHLSFSRYLLVFYLFCRHFIPSASFFYTFLFIFFHLRQVLLFPFPCRSAAFFCCACAKGLLHCVPLLLGFLFSLYPCTDLLTGSFSSQVGSVHSYVGIDLWILAFSSPFKVNPFLVAFDFPPCL